MDLFELVLGVLGGIFIGVVFFGELSVRSFDGVWGGVRLDSEDGVGVVHGGGVGLGWFWRLILDLESSMQILFRKVDFFGGIGRRA